MITERWKPQAPGGLHIRDTGFLHSLTWSIDRRHNYNKYAPYNPLPTDIMPIFLDFILHEGVTSVVSMNNEGGFQLTKDDLNLFLSHDAILRMNQLKCSTSQIVDLEYIAKDLLQNVAKSLCYNDTLPTSSSRTLSNGSSTLPIYSRKDLAICLWLIGYLIRVSNPTVLLCCLDTATILFKTYADFHDARKSDDEIQSMCHWLIEHFIELLRIAFADDSLPIRILATKLAKLIACIPSGVALLVNKLVLPNLLSDVTDSASPKDSYFVNCQSRLCQELIDLLTILLLCVEMSHSDRKLICDRIIENSLCILRPSVRAATLDCIAVLAHQLGPGELSPLLATVSRAAENIASRASTSFLNDHGLICQPSSLGLTDSAGLWNIVQGRLAQKQLPQLDSEGRIIRDFSIHNSQFSRQRSNIHYPVSSVGETANCDLVGMKSTRAADKVLSSQTFGEMANATGSKSEYKSLRRQPSTGRLSDRNRLPWNVDSTSRRCQPLNIVSSTPTDHPDVGSNTKSRTETPPYSDPCNLTATWLFNRVDSGSRVATITSTERYPIESQSVPASGQISPRSTDSPQKSRAASSRQLPDPTHPFHIPRPKPTLAPLNHKPIPRGSNSLTHSASSLSISPTSIPTRAIMGRQSGRSRLSTSRQKSICESAVELNRFGFRSTTPVRANNQQPLFGDSSVDSNGGQPTGNRDADRKSEDYGGLMDDLDVEDEIEDDLDDDEYDEAFAEEEDSSHFVTRLDTDSAICRSTDSELCENLSVRSAASHRRALRLFDEAERKQFENNFDDRSPLSPFHVSATESNCSFPIFTPSVVPAMPVQRAIPAKSTSNKRRGTLTNQSLYSTISTTVQKSSHQTEPMQTFTTTNKCDYSGLVIGRAAVGPNPSNSPQSSERIVSQLGRKPLKGQHNVSIDSSAKHNALPSSSSTINIVGRSLFDSRLVKSSSVQSAGDDPPLTESSTGRDSSETTYGHSRLPKIEDSNSENSAALADTSSILDSPEKISRPHPSNSIQNKARRSDNQCSRPPLHRKPTSADCHQPKCTANGISSKNSTTNCQPIYVRSSDSVSQADEHEKISGDFSEPNSSIVRSSRCHTPSIRHIIQQIHSDDWETKVTGLETLSQCSLDHPCLFTNSPIPTVTASAGQSRLQPHASTNQPSDCINQAVLAVITECRNLRSQVSRQAVQTLSALFDGLGRVMDPHVEICVRVLLGKTGEASAAFLRDEVAAAMDALTRTANPSRSLPALMQHGLGHKNPVVRTQTAFQIAQIIETLTNQNTLSQSTRNKHKPTERSISGTHNTGSVRLTSWGSASALHRVSGGNSPLLSASLMDRLVIAMSQFLTDGNQETRYHGRRLLKLLLEQPDLERNIQKNLTGQTLRVVREIFDQVKIKGVGDPPSASASLRRRGYSPAPTHSRSSSISRSNRS